MNQGVVGWIYSNPQETVPVIAALVGIGFIWIGVRNEEPRLTGFGIIWLTVTVIATLILASG